MPRHVRTNLPLVETEERCVSLLDDPAGSVDQLIVPTRSHVLIVGGKISRYAGFDLALVPG
jgi:hypothetical protein